MSAHFSEASLKFLRGLKRNNNREWFEERRSTYETEIKAAMLAIAEQINAGLDRIAPEYVHPPQKCVMRIYRDVRFSKNKDPYKTNVAAWWARQGLEKTSGAGFYFHFSAEELFVAGGCYMPKRDQLLAIRRYLMEHHGEFRKATSAKKFTSIFEPFDGLKLTRPPKGFPADHPAMDLILQKQWGARSALPLELATRDDLVPAVIERFKLLLPMVTILNAAIVPPAAKPVF